MSTLTQEEEDQGEDEQGFDDCNQDTNSGPRSPAADSDSGGRGLQELRKPTKCNSSKALGFLLSGNKRDEELINKYQLGLPKLSE